MPTAPNRELLHDLFLRKMVLSRGNAKLERFDVFEIRRCRQPDGAQRL